MKLHYSVLSIGILLAGIYYSLDEKKTGPFTSTPPFPSSVVKMESNTVKLFDFSVNRKGNRTELHWLVDKNENVNQFEIEKSTDGKNFKIAALVFGSEKSNTDSYMFYEKGTDKKVSYRIRLVDNKGAIIYSEIIEVNSDDLNGNNVALFKKEARP